MKQYLALGSFALLLSCLSCGKSSNATHATTGGNGQWTMGSYTYTGATSAQTTNASNLIAVVVSTAGNGGSYGDYSGSTLTLLFNNFGAGQYTLASTDTLAKYPGQRLMNVSCVIGTAVTTGSTMYDVATILPNAVVDVTVDNNGKYHFDMKQAAVLSESSVVNGGVPGAAGTFALTVDDAH